MVDRAGDDAFIVPTYTCTCTPYSILSARPTFRSPRVVDGLDCVNGCLASQGAADGFEHGFDYGYG